MTQSCLTTPSLPSDAPFNTANVMKADLASDWLLLQKPPVSLSSLHPADQSEKTLGPPTSASSPLGQSDHRIALYLTRAVRLSLRQTGRTAEGERLRSFTLLFTYFAECVAAAVKLNFLRAHQKREQRQIVELLAVVSGKTDSGLVETDRFSFINTCAGRSVGFTAIILKYHNHYTSY